MAYVILYIDEFWQAHFHSNQHTADLSGQTIFLNRHKPKTLSDFYS